LPHSFLPVRAFAIVSTVTEAMLHAPGPVLIDQALFDSLFDSFLAGGEHKLARFLEIVSKVERHIDEGLAGFVTGFEILGADAKRIRHGGFHQLMEWTFFALDRTVGAATARSAVTPSLSEGYACGYQGDGEHNYQTNTDHSLFHFVPLFSTGQCPCILTIE
jgi:hypothetical protein